MPTEEQLDIIFESQLEFFGGTGLPKQNFEGSSVQSFGLSQEKNTDIPINITNPISFKGVSIAQVQYCESTKRFLFTQNS